MDILLITFSLIFGACFGSFITMASYRLPLNENMISKRSYCPKCKKNIKILSLIPIFSWIFQNGKCLNCKEKISIRYPIIELITSIMFLISYLKFCFTCNTIIFDLIIVVCMIIAMTDIEHYFITNSCELVFLLFVMTFIIYNQFNLIYSIISAILYFLTIFIVKYIVEKIKNKKSIGCADIKLITISGLLLGIEHLSQFLFLSGIIGIIFWFIWKKYKKDEYFPFAPSLIISFISLVLYFY